MIGHRRFVSGLSGFQILFGVGALLDHDHAPVDLDLGILGDGLRFQHVRLSGGKGGVGGLNAGQSLLDDGLGIGHGGARRVRGNQSGGLSAEPSMRSASEATCS